MSICAKIYIAFYALNNPLLRDLSLRRLFNLDLSRSNFLFVQHVFRRCHMRKNDKNRKKKEWSKAIKEAFRLLGYEGDVIIEDDPDDSKRWFIEHTAFGCCFDGYPSTDDTYAITFVDHPFTDLNGMYKTHLEWLVFDSNLMVPLYYVVMESPDYQRIMIQKTPKYDRGEILYQNLDRSTSDKVAKLKQPIIQSEMIDLETLLHNLK